MMSCARAGQLMEGQLNQELGWRGQFELRAHLLVCSLCRAYRVQAQQIRRLLRGHDPSPLRLPAEARQRIARRIAEETELKP